VYRVRLFVLSVFSVLSVVSVLSAQTVNASAISRARAAIQSALAHGAAPGAAVAVATRDGVVWEEGFGLADLERRTPASAASRFGVGSISKAFTLAAALTLVDDGRFDLDRPLERYLADFPHAGMGITARRIAVHQSGLSDAFADAHYYSTAHFPDLDSAYRWIRSEFLMSPPGTRTVYATGLFTILGRALEVADGRPYPELMARRVFDRAGMRETLPNDPRAPDSARVTFYLSADRGGFTPAPRVDPSFKLPGAGFIATAGDVARFGAALLGDRLLSAGSRREMFTPVPLGDGTPTVFALGLQALTEAGHRVLLQPGGGPGITGWLAIYPDDGLVVALLSNTTGARLDEARKAVAYAFLAN
jgi:serine beta-lactamase-like protein LACTB, mitochondrial